MFVLVASVLAVFAALSQANPVIENRVVNGTDADIKDFPYMISLHYSNSHTCGGSIIDEYNILTAGHCVQRDVSRFSVLYGSSVLYDSSSTTIPVERIITHEGYTGGMPYHNDLAILHLKSPLPISNVVQPTRLAGQDSATPGESPAILTGWGLERTGGVIQETLKKVDIKVYTDEECEYLHRNSGPTSRTYHVCGGVPEGGKGQCSGDSGGPLVVDGIQVGIVSWSIKPCTVQGYPGVYTRVAGYTNWINANRKRLL